MRIRAVVVMVAKPGVVLGALWAGSACTHAGGHLMVDAPKLMPYQPPDADELAGIEPADDGDEAASPGPGSAQNPQQTPRK
jgi:hypothetical protein